MNLSRSAAIHTGPNTHLDHLAPICFLMNIPLITTDQKSALLAKEFYPEVNTTYMDPLDLSLDFVATHLDVIYECGKFWALDLLPLLKLLYQKKMRFIFCPHGNSDKESKEIYSNNALFQDIALVYGSHMKDVMHKNQMIKNIDQIVETGNLRLLFYQHCKHHFDKLANEKVFSKLDISKKTILYCPTWHTEKNPTSFFSTCILIARLLAPNYNLIIKLHPLLEETYPAQTYYTLHQCKNENLNVVFLDDFPSIYSLLEKIDLYIGDFSSVGYDFLFYNRPMIFLKPEKMQFSYLHHCGYCLDYNESKNLNDWVERSFENTHVHFMEMRTKYYEYAFGKLLDLKTIKRRINEAIEIGN